MKKSLLFTIALLTATAPAYTQGLKISQVSPASKQIVIQNFGNTTVNLSSHQFCSLFNYAALGSGSVTVNEGSLNLSAGASVTLTWNSAGAMNMNGSDLCLYQPNPAFTNPDHMIDFVQWNSAGNGRESVAVAAGLWAAGTFVDGNSPMSYIGDGDESGVQFWALDCVDPALIGSIDICPTVFAPVCGCDNVTYDNDCLAQTNGGVTSWTDGVCSAVEPGDCPELTPGLDFGMCAAVVGVALMNNECITISGCGTVASDGLDYAAYFYGSPSECEACLDTEECIDPEQIDETMMCVGIFDPVCGCDYVTYQNDCYAFYYGGVTSWTAGECSVVPAEPCTDVADVDFGDCDMSLGFAVVNNACMNLSGCGYIVDGVDYTPAFYGTFEECEFCLEAEDCIDPEQIDETMMCVGIFDPVCGCDYVTYQNDCYAFYYGGVTSWTPGECSVVPAEPCTDVAEVDFGLCDMYLGVAVVNGECQNVSGCGYEVDGVDYTSAFYDTIEECEACLETEECIDPDQIDETMICIQIYDPVCGCDNVTYDNDCFAFYYGGVTTWTEGECLPTNLNEQSNSFVIQSRTDFQIYVNSTISIESLVIYDLSGKIVTQFGTIAPGEHLLELPLRNAGIYLYHVYSKNQVETGKLFVR